MEIFYLIEILSVIYDHLGELTEEDEAVIVKNRTFFPHLRQKYSMLDWDFLDHIETASSSEILSWAEEISKKIQLT